MRSNGWQIAATARALGISRNTLYARMRRSGQIRKARDIPRGELAELYRRHDGDLAAIARSLDVSPRGLQLRLRELRRGG
jgi:transcriptional regulator with PAS, ATPase and Fis domain